MVNLIPVDKSDFMESGRERNPKSADWENRPGVEGDKEKAHLKKGKSQYNQKGGTGTSKGHRGGGEEEYEHRRKRNRQRNSD